MRTRPIALTLLVLFATTEAPARAATPRSVTHEDQRDVMVTIYNGNLGLVKDVREARFPAGRPRCSSRRSPPGSIRRPSTSSR